MIIIYSIYIIIVCNFLVNIYVHLVSRARNASLNNTENHVFGFIQTHTQTQTQTHTQTHTHTFRAHE